MAPGENWSVTQHWSDVGGAQGDLVVGDSGRWCQVTGDAWRRDRGVAQWDCVSAGNDLGYGVMSSRKRRDVISA